MSEEEQAKLDADLIAAIKASDTERAIAALERGANPNTGVEVNCWGDNLMQMPALILALTWRYYRNRRFYDHEEEPNFQIIRALVEKGARLSRDTPYGEPPLTEAVRFGTCNPGRLELAAFLLDHGAQINEKVPPYQSALYAACALADVEMIFLLLDRGADINACDGTGMSLLMSAAYSRQKEVVTALIERGADVHHRAWDGQTALTMVQGKSKAIIEIREMLEAAGAKLDFLEMECRRLTRVVEKTDFLDATIVDRWKELWHVNLEGEKFHSASILHAYLLCRLGWKLAEKQESYSAACDLIDRLLSHPEPDKLHATEYRDLYRDKLFYLLQSGAETQASRLARQLMTGEVDGRVLEPWFASLFPPECQEGEDDSEARNRRNLTGQATKLVWDTMKQFLKTIKAQQTPVSTELTTLVWDVVQETRPIPMTTRRLPEQATPKQLRALLSRRSWRQP
jgi:hypothetical protein